MQYFAILAVLCVESLFSQHDNFVKFAWLVYVHIHTFKQHHTEVSKVLSNWTPRFWSVAALSVGGIYRRLRLKTVHGRTQIASMLVSQYNLFKATID